MNINFVKLSRLELLLSSENQIYDIETIFIEISSFWKIVESFFIKHQKLLSFFLLQMNWKLIIFFLNSKTSKLSLQTFWKGLIYFDFTRRSLKAWLELFVLIHSRDLRAFRKNQDLLESFFVDFSRYLWNEKFAAF